MFDSMKKKHISGTCMPVLNISIIKIKITSLIHIKNHRRFWTTGYLLVYASCFIQNSAERPPLLYHVTNVTVSHLKPFNNNNKTHQYSRLQKCMMYCHENGCMKINVMFMRNICFTPEVQHIVSNKKLSRHSIVTLVHYIDYETLQYT